MLLKRLVRTSRFRRASLSSVLGDGKFVQQILGALMWMGGEGHRELCLVCRAKASSWEINGGAARAAHRPDRPGLGRDTCDHRLDLVDDPTALAG